MPKPTMAIRHQLTFGGELFERLTLERGIVSGDVVEDSRFKNKEPAVDPALSGLRLLKELRHAVALQFEATEARNRRNGGNRGQLPVRAMKFQQCVQVDVCQPITIGDHKGLVVQVRSQATQPATSQSIQAGVDQSDFPVGRRGLLHFAGTHFQIDEEIAVMHDVIVKVLFDDFAFVAARDDEVAEALLRIKIHNVPEHGFAADFDHRLGTNRGFFGESGSQAAGEYDHFHNERAKRRPEPLLRLCSDQSVAYLAGTSYQKSMIRTIRSVLALPQAYQLFWTVIGGPHRSKILVDQYIRPRAGDRILEIGCGPGTIVPYLPESEYVGFDMSPSYIAQAQKRFPRSRFVCERVSEYTLKERSYFDIVLALGIVHHLADAEAKQLFQIAHDALKPAGKLVTLDGVWNEGQSSAARALLARDRGQYVRDERGYVGIASKVFDNIKVSIRHDLLRIPYTHIIMECVR